MSCSHVTWGDLNFINHIDYIAGEKKQWHNPFQHLWGSGAWSFMKWDEWVGARGVWRPALDTTHKHWYVLEYWLITWIISGKLKSEDVIVHFRLHLFTILRTMPSALAPDCVIIHELKVKPWNCESSPPPSLKSKSCALNGNFDTSADPALGDEGLGDLDVFLSSLHFLGGNWQIIWSTSISSTTA